MQGRPVVIGIAGGSGSGKSTVLQQVIRQIGVDCITVLEHDAYYLDMGHLSHEERARINFDHPDSLETPLMRQHLDQLIAGETIQRPRYNFNTHRRLDETLPTPSRPVIIVEGILVLAEPVLRERMDIKIFVDTDDDIRLLRRIRRDITDRGRTVASVLDQYERTVRPMHVEFVEPSKRQADIIIPRGGENQVAIDMVLARIRSLIASSRNAALPAGTP